MKNQQDTGIIMQFHWPSPAICFLAVVQLLLTTFKEKVFFKNIDDFKKNIFENEETPRGNFFIDREFFMNFWKEISDCELIISAYFFRKKMGISYKMFTYIVDKSQRVKGVRGSYYKLSYVNKVLKENNLPLL